MHTQHPRTQQRQSLANHALNNAFQATAPVKARLCLQDLLSKLYLSHLSQYHPLGRTKTQRVAKELDRFLERLRERTNLSEAVTLNSFLMQSDLSP
jgi:hypothetical protein